MRLDPYVIDTLLPDLVGHDRRPSAFLTYLLLWRRAGAPSSLRELAEGTGLSKRAVQDAVGALAKRRLVAVQREGPTALARYVVLKPWKRGA
jgi:hypothetical protein